MAGRKKATATVKETAPVQETVVEQKVEAEEVKTEPKQQINMIVEQKAPPVKIIYIDSVIANNEIMIGGGRKITGSGRVFSVPMEHFEGEFMTPTVMELIDERKLIVLDGLTKEQRQQYNCDYKEGEVVREEGIFDSLIDMDTDKAEVIFGNLCAEHQKLVATRFMSAYFERHDNRITRDKVEALNRISKRHEPDGLFTPIVKEINDKMN